MKPTGGSGAMAFVVPPSGGFFSGVPFQDRLKAGLRATVAVGLLLTLANSANAGDGRLEASKLAEQLRVLPSVVLPEEEHESAADMIPGDLERRLRAANRRSSAEWQAIKTRDDWQRFRDEKLRLLREAIGPLPEESGDLRPQVTGTVDGDGYRVKGLVFQSRPGLWVTANLYVPAEPPESMPGLLICHSHHRPKEHGELQDMGMTWARKGCLVLIPDMLGHGERRQHPFATTADYHKSYRVSRQDYYFRYDTGMQLALVGESLMGWFVWDLQCCVTALLSQPGVDPKRIVLLGAVAGGGDPAAVAAALDPRITGAIAYNFGGAEPETRYPLPEDAELTFNYAGSGSFESTRNLCRSAGGGFLPWVIVGAVAPRPFIYAHEFAWDRPRDPVWKRLQRIWGLYGMEERLAATHGRGSVRGRPPESTHCTHIGLVHRRSIHPIFQRCFDISVKESDEYSARLESERLRCLTPEVSERLKPKQLHDLLPEIAANQIAAARLQQAKLSDADRRDHLRQEWNSVLGERKSRPLTKARTVARSDEEIEGMQIERVVLDVEPGIVVPLILLLPDDPAQPRVPVVVAVAHAGKGEFLDTRGELLAELLAGGAAVCLPDLRGLGETSPDGSRERWGAMTSQSSTELMLGGTMVGARLRDLRAVLKYLRGRNDVDSRKIALWGDSFAKVNPPDRDFQVPRHMDDRPRWSEPLGGLLALLGALYEDDVCAVYVRGGLSDFQSVIAEQFVYIPHDVVIPGVLTFGDVPDLAAAIAPRPLRLDNLVDGFNRVRPVDDVRTIYRPAVQSYQDAGLDDKLVIDETADSACGWLLEQL